MRVTREITRALKNEITARGLEKAKLNWLWYAIEAFPEQPVELAVKNAILNLRVLELFKRNPVGVGPYAITFSGEGPHPESVISLEVLDAKRERIATASFFVQKTQTERKLYINNIQGVKEQMASLDRLSNTVKEGWRAWIAKQLKGIADKHRFKAVGVLPKRNPLASSPWEYARQLKRYRKIFKDAGITEIDKSHVQRLAQRRSRETRKDDQLYWGWKERLGQQKRKISQRRPRK